jgi:hypothetical protein
MDADAPAASPASTNRLLGGLPVQDQVKRGSKDAIPENQ